MKTFLTLSALLATLIFVAACTHAPPAQAPDALPAEPAPEVPVEPEPAEGPGQAQEKEPLENTLRWTTASEVENFGFHIFRGRSEEGPFHRITGDPIPGAGTTDEPQSYVYKDADIETGVEYFYYIESISLAGVREKFSPVIRAPAKS